MAQYGDQYGNQKSQCDEHGNPILKTDECGKPVHHGAHATGTDVCKEQGKEHSSSCEEKGIKEKIKEKLPGGHKDDQQTHSTATTPPATTGHCKEGEQQEKKGIMDKIKEKLPGGHPQ